MMRFVGERRALAAAVLAFFMMQLLLSGLFVDSPFRLMLIGLGLAYGTAFVGVVAGYFWARWYALGLAFWGMAMPVMVVIRGGEPSALLYILFGSHAAIWLGLAGIGAATFYDGRRDWRDRLKMDDNAVNRLGKAITRAGASLPYLIIIGLFPKEEQMREILGLVALGSGVLGLAALVRLRAVGILALGVALVAAIVEAAVGGSTVFPLAASAHVMPTAVAALAAALLLAAAVAPFVRPVVRHLTRPY